MTRLLVIVLTLMGPLPIRVCTCVAAPVTHTNSGGLPTLPKAKTCSCGHHHDSAEAATAKTTGTPGKGIAATHPTEHQSGCPMAQPRPVADATSQLQIRDLTPDAAPESIVTVSDSFFSPRHQLSPHVPVHRAPARPLFITLLTLRN